MSVFKENRGSLKDICNGFPQLVPNFYKSGKNELTSSNSKQGFKPILQS